MLQNGPNLIALDFDGVLCDTAEETAISAWRAGQSIWPEWNTTRPTNACLQRFRQLRPVLETGYQALGLMYMAYRNVEVNEVYAHFPKLLHELYATLQLDKAQLVAIFGQARDAWIAENRDEWLAAQTFFPGVITALQRAIAAQHPLFIVTTKQERFVRQLLAAAGITEIPPANVFGLERKQPKSQTLAELISRPEFRDLPCHFVEDRLPTLQNIAAQPALDRVQLYLAEWGYNTPAERQQIAEHDGHKRIALLPISDFLR